MLTALTAEDKLLVRLGIRSGAPWPELDVAVVGEAQDGPEAWKLHQKYRPDIVLFDIMMPDMNGVELLRKIRPIDRRCGARSTSSSYRGWASIREIALRCGYNDFSCFSGRFRRFCGVTPHAWRERSGGTMS